MAREGKNLELSVVNPVAVFGPVLGADYSTSILLIQGHARRQIAWSAKTCNSAWSMCVMSLICICVR